MGPRALSSKLLCTHFNLQTHTVVTRQTRRQTLQVQVQRRSKRRQRSWEARSSYAAVPAATPPRNCMHASPLCALCHHNLCMHGSCVIHRVPYMFRRCISMHQLAPASTSEIKRDVISVVSRKLIVPHPLVQGLAKHSDLHPRASPWCSFSTGTMGIRSLQPACSQSRPTRLALLK